MSKHVKIAMNQIVIGGNLANDPKQFTGKSGKAFTLFTIAVNDYENNQTDFIDSVAFGSQGDAVLRYLRKGDAVLVTGKLSARLIQDGATTRNSMRVKALRVQFLDPIERPAIDDGQTAAAELQELV